MAFLPYSAETYEILQEIRSTISNRHHSASTLGYGPRFLHSTGQLHKGGPNKGVFIQFTADDSVDMMIPGTRDVYKRQPLENAHMTNIRL